MASTQIPRTPDTLISHATDAADGAATQGASVGLRHNNAAEITAELLALIGDPAASPPIPGARPAYHLAKSAKTTATAACRSVESNSRAFCGSAVNLLRNFLGNQWNSQWQAAGFTGGSLAIPDDTLPMLGELRAYFIAHPGHENAPLALTAAECTARIAALGDARTASNHSVTALGQAKSAHDAAVQNLYQRMTGLRSELEQLLPADDPRWYSFGFDRPTDGTGPGPIPHLVFTADGSLLDYNIHDIYYGM